MTDIVKDYNDYRERMNNNLLANENIDIKRFFNIDTNAYKEGALPVKTKELMGLVASMVLRCDDCIKYHLQKCYNLGLTTKELIEVFAIANIVGGSIVIPHTRRALEFWEALNEKE